jgi:hypothetical protein
MSSIYEENCDNSILIHYFWVKGRVWVQGGSRPPTPERDTSLDSVHWTEHFDTTLDHLQPEHDPFWPTPDERGRTRQVIHRWTQNIELSILIPHSTIYLKQFSSYSTFWKLKKWLVCKGPLAQPGNHCVEVGLTWFPKQRTNILIDEYIFNELFTNEFFGLFILFLDFGLWAGFLG